MEKKVNKDNMSENIDKYINKIHHLDFLDNSIPDKSINLIIADPPYFGVKGDFDFIWSSFDDYLKDVEKWAIECKRILADTGTLLWYGHAKNIAYSQIIFDKHFNLLNSIVWEKTVCRTKRTDFDQSRVFAPVTERVLMYSNEIEMTGFEFIEKEYIAPRNPFAKELKKARLKKGVSINAVAEYGKFYGNVNHGGAVTNWERGYNIPQKEQWEILCNNLPIERQEYEDLRQEYEELRRPFNNDLKLLDVMRFDQEANISKKYNHDTIKPEKLTTALINTCSRKGDIVCVPFAGSGTECAMSAKEGRDFIGFEIDENHVKTSRERVKEFLDQGVLF